MLSLLSPLTSNRYRRLQALEPPGGVARCGQGLWRLGWAVAVSLGLLPIAAVGVVPAGQSDEQSPKVVLVSLDGAADWLVDEFLARGVLPPDGAFATLARTGVRAEAMVPIAESMTAPSHTAMFTGTYPERNGIVSNTFLSAGDPISRSTDGFEASIEAETLWQAAQRQGKRVFCVAAVGANIEKPERRCDLTLAYGHSQGRPSMVKLAPAGEDWTTGRERFEHAQPLAPADASVPLAFTLDDDSVLPLHAIALDTTFDQRRAFDAVLLGFDTSLANGYAARLAGGRWAPLWLDRGRGLGAWVRLMSLASEDATATLYLGAPGSQRSEPPSFVATLNERAGPWPDGPDDTRVLRGEIPEEMWQQQAARLSTRLSEATLMALRQPEWDLLLTYLPVIDETQHAFLLRDPRQHDYDAEQGARRARFNRHLEWAYRLADRLLGEWMAAAPPGTNFVVVSDHGVIPTHTMLLLNNALAQAGFRVTEDNTSEVRAYTSGSTAHIYVNLAGRQPGGVVPAEKYGEYVERIVAACHALSDPLTGEPLLQVVRRKSELDAFHMNHPGRSGDVWGNAAPGFALSGRIDPKRPILEVAGREHGQHGYVGSNRRIHAIFFAAGPHVPQGTLGTVNAVDVAPTVAALLGIEPPRDVQGRAVLRPVD